MRVIDAASAAALVLDGARVVTGGFGSCGHPDSLTKALEERFLKTGKPNGLKLLFAAGSGDKAGRGLDRLAHPGLLDEAVGGFWGLCPSLGGLARSGAIAGHNWPQGVISRLFSEAAAKRPGLITKVGLGTFIDPAVAGGVIGSSGVEPMVLRVQLLGQDYLFYPALPIDFALLRGTVADPDGNIGFYEETSYMDALAQATAVSNSGGTVIVQVKRLVGRSEIIPTDVRIPATLVDYVVVASDEDHPQTYGDSFNQGFIAGSDWGNRAVVSCGEATARRVIADRAVYELERLPGARVNLGIGIPALVGKRAAARGLHDFTLSVESGLLGGIPAEGLSFGASVGRSSTIEQSALFDLYDGGGLDIAFLGFGEVDKYGRVNVSRLGKRFTGAGGFVNISQAARRIVFCGTFTAGGLVVREEQGVLRIVQEGRFKKFVPDVDQITFDPSFCAAKSILYVTERCVFELSEGALSLIEIAAGFTPVDIQALVPFEFGVSESLTLYRSPGPSMLTA